MKITRRRVLLVAAGTAVFLAAVWTAWNVSATRDLEQAIGEARAAGLPTSLRELYPRPVPPEQNAAPLYQAACQLAEALPAELDLKEIAARLPEVSAEVRAVLPSFEEALELVHRAARLPSCQFPLRYEDGYAMRIPHVPQMRRLGHALAARAAVRAEANDLEGAQGDLGALFAMTRALGDEPLFVSQVVRFDTARSGLRALEVVLARASSRSAVLERVKPDDGRGGVARGLPGELAMCLSILELKNLEVLFTLETMPRTWKIPGLRGPLLKSDLARLVRFDQECLRALERPYAEAIARMEELQERCRAEGGAIVSFLLGTFARLARQEAELAAAVDALRSGG